MTAILVRKTMVTHLYGLADGGLSIDGWDNNLTLNEGSPLPAGTHLKQVFQLDGERYFPGFFESLGG